MPTMRSLSLRFRLLLPPVALTLCLAPAGHAQSNSGSVTGTVKDATGAIIPGATVVIANPGSGYTRTATSDAAGQFRFPNVPFNPYQVTVSYTGFAPSTQAIGVSSTVAVTLPITLQVAAQAGDTITVTAPVDLVEKDPNFHTDVDRSTIDRLPVESPSSQLSAIVTELSPGVAADSNGLLHGLGDHNEVSFSVDGQPITDQQSKVFSNQLPASAVQSLEVIEGAPPAEYGDKTSLVIVATTRSGQGVTRPTGSVALSYGSFGTENVAVDLAYGGKRFGNFVAASGLESGRFLDAPEFETYHDKGNEENFFDRFDYQLDDADSLHTNIQYTRSLFETPNSYDTQYNFVQSGQTSAATDQRSKIGTVLFAPTYTRTVSDNAVFNLAPYVRRDAFNYIPSGNPLNDLGPIQAETVSQYRTLTNAGVHSDLSYVKGANNIKFGLQYAQTFLNENFNIGLVDPNLNPQCFSAIGQVNLAPVNCSTPGFTPNPNFNPVLAPYDLTRGGSTYAFHGHTDIKQLALYGEDKITEGNFILNLGLRGDFYNGLSIQRQAEPRLGVSYNVKRTGTVLRTSYARTQETPFNENLILSSQGCLNPVINAIFSTIGPCNPAPFNPGFRNEFHAGFQQSITSHFTLGADYIWKYTHNGFDFSVLGATPITFPIEWHNSKIPGFVLSGTLSEYKGFTARITMSSVAARFFNPQIGGIGATIGQAGSTYPFRIDHDERFNQTTHFEYKLPFRKTAYYSFNWKFDSGLVAGAVPCYNVSDPNSTCLQYSLNAQGSPLTLNGQPAINLSSLTSDEEFQAGLTCNGVRATQTAGFSICQASQLTSKLVKIPVAGTEDDDHNPQRIAPRNLFDMELGDDDLYSFRKDRYKMALKLTAINVTNKYALYNFLSTFSGTHYLSPASVTAELSLHF